MHGLAAGARERHRRWLSRRRAPWIGLARAILGDPRLLLHDEVEAHLDDEAVSTIDRILDDRHGRATTVIVTQRIDLMTRADVVWRLHEGRLVAVERAPAPAPARSSRGRLVDA